MTAATPSPSPSIPAWMLRWGEERHVLWRFGLLLLLLMLHMPAHGVMSTKEEVYFIQALRTIHPERFGQDTATHAPEPLWQAFYTVAGPMVASLSGENAQRAGRILTAVGNAAALTVLASVLGLGLLDLLIIIPLFILSLQNVMGQEWMFVSFEPKVLAYPCIVMAIARLLQWRSVQAGLWLAAATVFHVLVGLQWGSILLIFLAWEACRDREKVPHLTRLAGVWLLAAAPFMVIVAGPFLLDALQRSSLTGPSGLTADWIYTYVIDPIHVAPFKDLGEFSRWDQGIGLGLGILLLSMGITRTGHGLYKRLARLSALTMAWLLASLVASYVDTGGALGKCNLYRPASLGLLLTLMAVTMYVTAWLREKGRIVKFAAVALLLPVLVPHLFQDILEPILDHRRERAAQAGVRSFLAAHTLPQSAVLLHPRLDDEFLWLERTTYHPTIINRRNTPDHPDGILDWHAVFTWRGSVFSNGCAGLREAPGTRASPPHVDYILMPRKACTKETFRPCGSPVFQDAQFVLFAMDNGEGA